jgi:glutathione S-transferase
MLRHTPPLLNRTARQDVNVGTCRIGSGPFVLGSYKATRVTHAEDNRRRHAGLLPDDANARARAITWMFVALNTVEPPILDCENTRLLEGDKTWYEQRLPVVEDRIRDRLGELSGRLGDADWLDGAFSAGDLMMVAVLLRLKASGMLDEYPNLTAVGIRRRSLSPRSPLIQNRRVWQSRPLHLVGH